MDMVDILINVHPDLSNKERSLLETDLRDIDGVISVHFSAEHPHLLTLEYNPAQTSSEALLNRIGDRGVEASKIGL
ncbi:MAG: hypothetical protein RRB22_06945 [Gammaproteobacteria bacterium]|nr:hypothetical protein [Gammaproteobacteria bacterium]